MCTGTFTAIISHSNVQQHSLQSFPIQTCRNIHCNHSPFKRAGTFTAIISHSNVQQHSLQSFPIQTCSNIHCNHSPFKCAGTFTAIVPNSNVHRNFSAIIPHSNPQCGRLTVSAIIQKTVENVFVCQRLGCGA